MRPNSSRILSYSDDVRPIVRARFASTVAIGLSIACCGLFSGCSPGAHRYVGEWEGNHDLPYRDEEERLYARFAGQVKLVIRSDGTFTLTEAGLPKTGEVLFGRRETTLRVRRVMGREPEGKMGSDVTVRLLEDGRLELVDPGGLVPEPVILRRVAQPPEPGARKQNGS